MPHDKHSQLLYEGDEVIIRARVTRVMDGEEYCNVDVETLEPMFPGTHKSKLTLNTRQVERVGAIGISAS